MVGNHEYETPGAEPYFTYFGASAGPAGLGYYSFEIGAWHAVALNSNIDVSPLSGWTRLSRWRFFALASAFFYGTGQAMARPA